MKLPLLWFITFQLHLSVKNRSFVARVAITSQLPVTFLFPSRHLYSTH